MPKLIPSAFAEALISAVENRESLYNIGHPQYRNRNVAELSWKGVADEVERDVQLCKATWASLRCTFNRNMASIKNMRCGSGANHQPKWHFFNQMLFLTDHVSHGPMASSLAIDDLLPPSSTPTIARRSSSCSASTSSTGSVEINNQTQDTSTMKCEVLWPLENETKETVVAEVRTHTLQATPGRRKRKAEDPVQEAMIEDIHSRAAKQSSQKTEDPDLAFFKGLLPFFQQLPAMKKMQFMGHTTTYLMELYEEAVENQK